MYYIFIALILIFAGCGESSNNGTGKGPETESQEQISLQIDCRAHLAKNIHRCYSEISKMMPDIDSNLVYDYCDCVNKEIVNQYTCEQILSMKKLSEKELRQIYLPIKAKCRDLFLKDEMERARQATINDSL